MHGEHKDTHMDFPIYRCNDCGRTGFKDILIKSFNGVLACNGCNSTNIKELEDES